MKEEWLLGPAWIIVALALVFAPVDATADCYVTWDCGGSSQCAQVYGGASGRRGPYASCSGASQDRVSHCSCDAGASQGGASAGGYAPQQQVMLQGAAALGSAIGQALHDKMVGDQQRAAQDQAAQQAAQAAAQREREERAAEEAREVEAEQKTSRDKFNADKDQLLGQLRDDDGDGKMKSEQLGSAASGSPDSGLQFKADDPEDASNTVSSAPEKMTGHPVGAAHDAAYLRGLRDGGDCGTQNAGGYCAGLSAQATSACSQSYHRGYRIGERAAKTKLLRAWQEGADLKKAGKPFQSSAHPAEGSCGTPMAETYADGYYGRPFTVIGR